MVCFQSLNSASYTLKRNDKEYKLNKERERDRDRQRQRERQRETEGERLDYNCE